MRGAVGGLRLPDGLVAHEITIWLAVVDVNVGHLVAAVSLTVGSHERWQPPRRRASDALAFLTAQSGTLCCGHVEQRTASKALGRVVRRADGLFKRVR